MFNFSICTTYRLLCIDDPGCPSVWLSVSRDFPVQTRLHGSRSCLWWSIVVNAAGVAGVATPNIWPAGVVLCSRPPNILTYVLFFPLQRNFWIPQVAVIFICNAPSVQLISDLFTDFSQLVVRLTPTHISNDLIITRNPAAKLWVGCVIGRKLHCSSTGGGDKVLFYPTWHPI